MDVSRPPLVGEATFLIFGFMQLFSFASRCHPRRRRLRVLATAKRRPERFSTSLSAVTNAARAFFGTMYGGRSRKPSRGRPDDEAPSRASLCVRSRCGVAVELDPPHEAAGRACRRWRPCSSASRASASRRTTRRLAVLREEAAFSDFVENVRAEAAGDGVSAERRAVLARLHERRDPAARRVRRRAAGRRRAAWRARTMSGMTPRSWNAKRCPVRPRPHLDLVEDEQRRRPGRRCGARREQVLAA